MTTEDSLSGSIYELNYFIENELPETEKRLKKILELVIEDNKNIKTERDKLKERLENDKLPDCLGNYGKYLDCECICFYDTVCSRLSKVQNAIKDKCKHCHIVVDDRLCKAVCPVPSIEEALK